MSRYTQPAAKSSAERLLSGSATQIAGYIQGSAVAVQIQNNDLDTAIAVILWSDAEPPSAANVQASGIVLQPGGSGSFSVAVGGTGAGDARNVRPRFYGVSLVGDQSAANTQVSENRA